MNFVQSSLSTAWADLLEPCAVAIGQVCVMQHVQAPVSDVVVAAIEPRVPVEAGDHDEHGQDQDDHTLCRQI